MLLFSGSFETIKEIHNKGIFGGIFSSKSKSVAESHGEIVHAIEIADDKVLTQNEIDYHVSFDAKEKSLTSIIEKYNLKIENFDRIYEIVCEEKQITEEDFAILNESEFADASWFCQKLRGEFAKKLGYDAVECDDEHGISILIISNVKIEVLN
jgi:hypothetical protein